MNVLAAFTLVLLLIKINGHVLPKNYDYEKNALLEEEAQAMLGGQLQLNEEETQANDILMKWKHEELNTSFQDPQHFNFSKHYFTYKNDIPNSKVYQIIKKMPKGAVLHVHSSMMLDAGILVNLTYEDNLYGCYIHNHLTLHFSNSTPDRPCRAKWHLISDLRQSSGDPDSFDATLRQYFTMYRDNSDDYSNLDINTVWKNFDSVYFAIKSLLAYRPVRESYWYETLKRYYKDNVMYIEIRTGLTQLYELDGKKHDKKYLVELYERVTNQFIDDHPDFIGVKLILTRHRAQSVINIAQSLNLAKKLKAEMPHLIAGFDLVGQEDLGRPLKEFLPILSEARNEMDYYFHAGETLWYGTSTDENLADAILLGSKRIGHGYALLKHPRLMATVVNKDIALEVNVISNNVLGLVTDLRNHPLAVFLSSNVPVVLSSDDPGAWDADPLSTDFFVVFMGVASRNADLRMLKQLAINSIKYSALDEDGKNKLFQVFNKRWSRFICEVIGCEL